MCNLSLLEIPPQGTKKLKDKQFQQTVHPETKNVKILQITPILILICHYLPNISNHIVNNHPNIHLFQIKGTVLSNFYS